MNTCIGRVSLNRALELLGQRGDPVKQSALSRYVAKYADALNPVRKGREITVDFETLTEHRSQNIHRGSPASNSEPGAAKSSSVQRGRADEAALNIRAQRQMRELELAERMKSVTPVREVQDAARDAISEMKNAFALALNDAAEAIATVAGVEPRIIRPELRRFEKKGLDAFVRVLADLGLAEETQPAAA